jgi:hypothetical protein
MAYAFANAPFFRPLPGLGTTSPTATQEGTAIGGAVGSTTVATLVATGAVAGPVGAAIGAGIALVATLIDALGIGKGCGQTCIETSQWANQAEPLLLQNIQAYFAQPAPRSLSSQQAALANFQTVWNNLVTLCTQPNLGTAGQNCIADRQQGACKWKQTSTSPLLAYTQYGEPATGQCWNWWSGYHDPIANDPDVVADSQSALAQGAADTSASVLSSLGISSSYAVPALIAAAVVVAWLVLK